MAMYNEEKLMEVKAKAFKDAEEKKEMNKIALEMDVHILRQKVKALEFIKGSLDASLDGKKATKRITTAIQKLDYKANGLTYLGDLYIEQYITYARTFYCSIDAPIHKSYGEPNKFGHKKGIQANVEDSFKVSVCVDASGRVEYEKTIKGIDSAIEFANRKIVDIESVNDEVIQKYEDKFNALEKEIDALIVEMSYDLRREVSKRVRLYRIKGL